MLAASIGAGGEMATRRRRFEIRLHGRRAQIAAACFGVALITVSVVGCVLYHSDPAPEPLPERFRPTSLQRLDRIEGWVPSWGDEQRVAAEAIEAGFTDLLFFHGSVAEDGAVKLEDPAGLERGRNHAVLNGVRTWLTFTNHGKSLEGALGAGRIDAHADSVVAAFRASRCQHIDLDYESLTGAQAEALPALARALLSRLDDSTRISFTLQPVDDVFRPKQADTVRELLEMPRVHTMRFMMYDYHWAGSLPGALCPIDSFERLLKFWPRHAHKLTMALPLYGYDWPRPMDTSIPKAKSVTLRDAADLARQPAFEAAWMSREAELACRYGDHWVALPSFRAITRRVDTSLENGVPAVAFWHLGCGRLGDVSKACERGASVPEPVSARELESWDEWLLPYKRKVCTVVQGDGRTLDEYAQAYGITRAAMFRFNEHIERDTKGREIFLPR
jgi:hypothetical protein